MTVLLQPLRGAAAMGCLIILTLAGCIPLLTAALAKLLLPWPRARARASRTALFIARGWARIANRSILLISGTQVIYEQPLPDNPNARYLLISNHQCWADALLLVHVVHARLPFPRFLIKEQLRWLPIIGLAFWALDFPFLKRHSRAQVEANPQLRQDDEKAVRRACAIFRNVPVLLVNYAEGTRSTRKKREKFDSPYRALLPPKVGGIAIALNAMHGVLDGVLDMSIAYVDTPEPTFWGLLCGRINKVVIRVRLLPLPDNLATGDYGTNPANRARLKDWLNGIWLTKDQEVSALQKTKI